MYKYKKFGHDMIIEANTRQRISLLKQIEEMKNESDQAHAVAKAGDTPGKSVDELAKDLVQQYQDALRGETAHLNTYT